MMTDICRCGTARGAHPDVTKLLKPVAEGAAPAQVAFEGCLDFRLDRKATWAAERGIKRRRMCTLLTGCVVCGDRRAVTYHKDAQGNLRHTGCPGPAAAKLASTDKSKMEAPR